MNWTTLIASIFKPIADSIGSTMRYKRDQRAKEAALKNLEMFVLDELDEIMNYVGLPDKSRKAIDRHVRKAFDKFDKDSIVKG